MIINLQVLSKFSKMVMFITLTKYQICLTWHTWQQQLNQRLTFSDECDIRYILIPHFCPSIRCIGTVAQYVGL